MRSMRDPVYKTCPWELTTWTRACGWEVRWARWVRRESGWDIEDEPIDGILFASQADAEAHKEELRKQGIKEP